LSESEKRRKDLAAMHAIQKALGMDDDSAMALKLNKTGVSSAGDMTAAQRAKYLGALRSAQRAMGGTQPASRPQAQDPQSRKIRALWLALADAGKVRDRSEAALAAYVQRQTGVGALQWLSVGKGSAVIESLKQWLARQPKPTVE
jgi:phage gp16-like protein